MVYTVGPNYLPLITVTVILLRVNNMNISDRSFLIPIRISIKVTIAAYTLYI